MRLKRSNKLLIEPPSCATGDIAFNLIVFFLVCASTQPDSGRPQDIPRSDPQTQNQQENQNIEVAMDKVSVFINGDQITAEAFLPKLKTLLDAKGNKPEDRIVVVKSAEDTPYSHWIEVTGLVDQAGGIVTLQLAEEQTVVKD
jgi:biopolymer transport protein ExbD